MSFDWAAAQLLALGDVDTSAVNRHDEATLAEPFHGAAHGVIRDAKLGR